MSDRFDEAKGQVKETVGDVTGNEEMEREGRAEKTAAKAEREAKGAADQAGGKVKETVGKITGDEETEAEGRVQQKEGDLKRAG